MVAAGNSIGGFLAASLAADYKPLVQGKIRTFKPTLATLLVSAFCKFCPSNILKSWLQLRVEFH